MTYRRGVETDKKNQEEKLIEEKYGVFRSPLNNILTHHLEQYKDDIHELYERKTQKPF